MSKNKWQDKLLVSVFIFAYYYIANISVVHLIDHGAYWAFLLYGFGQGVLVAAALRARYLVSIFAATLAMLVVLLLQFRIADQPQLFTAAMGTAFGSNLVSFYKFASVQFLVVKIKAAKTAMQNQKTPR